MQNNIQKIYSSPLTRARQTAEKVSQRLHIPVIIKNELKEICYGEFEGRTREELKKLPFWKIREKNFFQFVHPGSCLAIPGGSYAMLYERLLPFFKSLVTENQSVVIVAHVGVVRCAVKFYEHKTDEELKRLQIGNGEALALRG